MPTVETAEQERKLIHDVSAQNIDEMIRLKSFSGDIEKAINDHINLEYRSWYSFKKLSADCARTNVALHGFAMFFGRCAAECYADAYFLEKYLVQRGGTLHPQNIPAPQTDACWPDHPVDPIQPLQCTLKLERSIMEDAQRLCAIADQHKDYALQDVIQSRFLEKETKHVKDMGDLLKEAVRVSKVPGHGLYHLDKELRSNNGVVPWGSANKASSADELLQSMAGELGSLSTPIA
ncbi:hypothetical protein HK102_003714, partial [Quaeritorhiza haematococci]